MENVYIIFLVIHLPVFIQCQLCDNDNSVTNICNWQPWTLWSACSQTCGGYGTQSRYRKVCCTETGGTSVCINNGQNEDRQCGNNDCYNGGTYQGGLIRGCVCLWTFKGTCCETERQLLNQPSSSYTACNSGLCNWTPWEEWSSCTVTCGGGGTQRRERSLCCPDGYYYDECLTNCGIDSSVSRFEDRVCGETCLYSGEIKEPERWGCDCLDRTFGHCCEQVLPGCLPYPADVIFVLDSSVSQTKTQFERQLEFVKSFIDNVNISYTEFQISVITFSWDAQVDIAFNQSESREVLKSLVDDIPFRPGGTNTHKGLRMAMDVARKSERRKGMVTFTYVIVLTDGMSSKREETKKAAKELKTMNLRVVSIGIGLQVSQQELRDISSPGDSNNPSYVFSVGDFNALDTMLKNLVKVTCEKCIRSYRSDIAFLIDEDSLSVPEFQTVIDTMTHMVRQMQHFEEDSGIRVTVAKAANEIRIVKPLNEQKTTDEFLILLQTLTASTDTKVCEKDSTCEALNITHAINYTMAELQKYERVNARQFIVIFTSGRFQNIDIITEEMSALRNQTSVKLFTIGPGLDVNMEGLLSLVDEANHVYVIQEDNDMSNIDVLQTEFSYNECVKE